MTSTYDLIFLFNQQDISYDYYLDLIKHDNILNNLNNSNKNIYYDLLKNLSTEDLDITRSDNNKYDIIYDRTGDNLTSTYILRLFYNLQEYNNILDLLCDILKININHKNNLHETSMLYIRHMYFFEEDYMKEYARILINHGSDVFIQDNHNKNILDYLQENDIYSYLYDYINDLIKPDIKDPGYI